MLILLVVAITLLLNAVLACVEMAFVSVSRSELQRLVVRKNSEAQLLLDLRQKPERTLSVLQIGITLVGAISAAVGGAGAEENLSPLLMQSFLISESVADSISVAIVVVPLTFFSVVIGELVPKTLALRNPLNIALFSARPLLIFDKALAPVVWCLERSTKLILKLMSFNKKPILSKSAIRAELEISTLSDTEHEYVLNLTSLRNKNLGQIVVPWDQVVFVNEGMTREEVLKIVIASRHTRLPVLLGSELVTGILHTKEFVALMNLDSQVTWQTLIRPALHVSASNSIVSVLRLMQKSRNHMSVVSQLAGPLVGIVTMEDIFSEIVGDIFDEDDDGRLKRLLRANPKFSSFSNDSSRL